tara:strand:+ start:378 stop:1127 length:750 start_codon:yes stop_codon:yes gene_type:complete
MCKKTASSIFKDKINIYVSECLSTNDFLTKYVKKNPQDEGIIIISDFQTRGKGQRANTWQSDRGKNLLFSFLVKPELSINDQFKLHIITSISIIKTLSKVGIHDAKIKWPNDIYIRDKKVSGILIESQVSRKKITQSIIGIGLNINQTQFNRLNATSTYNELNINLDIKNTLKIFCTFFDEEYLKVNEDIESLKNNYMRNLYQLNKEIKFTYEKNILSGRIVDIDQEGSLVISSNGNKEKFNFGSISFI